MGKNSPVVRETDPYGKALFAKWNKTPMTAFSNLKDEEIKSILDYADAYQPPAAAKGGNNEPAQDNSFLFGILTLILAIVAFILLQVNSNLRKLSDDKDGIFRGEPVPFYRNKTYLMAGVLLLAAVGMYLTMSGWNGKGGE